MDFDFFAMVVEWKSVTILWVLLDLLFGALIDVGAHGLNLFFVIYLVKIVFSVDPTNLYPTLLRNISEENELWDLQINVLLFSECFRFFFL